ncbi:uncharacterized protein VTP21DRAFT_8022 [Calcarisporiella thermophila]|uniref:uncharacterized protein n=1 Tax=Calcarisporiella thermophila TaxID=911321 RepID=UPI0037441ADA
MVSENTVPLRVIVERLVRRKYADLQNLTDVLPSMSDTERKRQILEYTMDTRRQFIKLLVLTKWASNAKNVKLCNNIIGFLRQQENEFIGARFSLQWCYDQLAESRIPNYDIPTAVDVLTTGTYQNMPEIIKATYVPPKPMSDEEVSAALLKLDDAIRIRLLCDETVPLPMRCYRVENGRATFHIKNEFEVALTLVPIQSGMVQLRWHIVTLNILVKPSGDAYTDAILSDQQIFHLTQLASQQLIPPSTQQLSVPGTGIEQKAVTNIDKGAPHFPLVKLYDYLHMFCLNMQLEILFLQAMKLARLRWAEQLHVEMDLSTMTLRLGYWSNSPSVLAQLLTNENNSINPRENLTLSSQRSSGAQLNPGRSNLASSNFLTISIVNEPSDSLSSIVSDSESRIMEWSRSWIQVQWSAQGEDEQDKSQETIDAGDLNVERLLLKFLRLHARLYILKFRDLLLADIESGKSWLNADDIKVLNDETKDSTTKEETQSTPSSQASSASLLVRFLKDRYVIIGVNIRTGRIIVSEMNGADENDARLKRVEEQINESFHAITDILRDLRFATIIEEIDASAKYLGLDTYRRIAIKPEDIAKFGGSLQHVLFLQCRQHPEYYIFVCVMNGQLQLWLIALRQMESGLYEISHISRLKPEKLLRSQQNSSTEHLTDIANKEKRIDFDSSLAEDEVVSKFTHQEPDPRASEFSLDLCSLSRIYSLCRAWITTRKLQEQLQSSNIPFRIMEYQSLSPRLQTGGQQLSADIIPYIRVSIKDLLWGIRAPAAAYSLFGDVSMRATGWWAKGPRGCKVLMQVKMRQHHLPPIAEGKISSEHFHLNRSTSTLMFLYRNVDCCLAQFQEELRRVVMLSVAAHQIHCQRWLSDNSVILESFDLQTLALCYTKKYRVNIKWDASSGQGRFVLDFTVRGNTARKNPHHRIAFFLQDMFNYDADLRRLVATLLQTLPLLSAADKLQTKCLVENRAVAVIPRSATHLRIVYSLQQKKHALDLKLARGGMIAILDGAQPTLPNPMPIPLLDEVIRSIDDWIWDHEGEGEIRIQNSIKNQDLETNAFEDKSLEKDDAEDLKANEEDDLVLPLERGVLCSRRLVMRVLLKLDEAVKGDVGKDLMLIE